MLRDMAKKTGMDRVREIIEKARRRRKYALELRNQGMTVQQVGDRLGVTKQKASEILKRAKQEAQAPT